MSAADVAPVPDECPNDSRGWHLWSARHPTCLYCGGDMRGTCICDQSPRCPMHNPHPDESMERASHLTT